MTQLIAYDNRALGHGAFTAGTGSWESSPSIDNLGNMQPQRYAEVTPSGGAFDFTFESQDSAGAAENQSPDVYALLGHTLPDSAVVTFKDGATTIGQVTVDNPENQPQNAILVASSATTLDTLTVEVASAGSDKVRLGGLWTSASFRPTNGLSLQNYSKMAETLSTWTRIDTTIWANSRGVVHRASFEWPMLTRSEANGPDMPNWTGITILSGRHNPVILIPDSDNLHESTYGLFDTFLETRPAAVPLAARWVGGASILEMT
jgi:hypothetical protein